jgi:hypothetical protein
VAYSDEERWNTDTVRLIASHYFWQQKRAFGKDYSHASFAKDIGVDDSKKVTNFLSAQASDMWEVIKSGISTAVTKPAYLSSAPDCIRTAIHHTYGIVQPAPYYGIIQDIFQNIADARSEEKQNVAFSYAGVWNILRYAAHDTSHDFKAIDLGEGKFDALVVRAAMVIGEYYPKTDDFPAFKIHYRPGLAKHLAPIKYTDGCVVPHRRGPHLLFFGAEEDSGYPLSITTLRAHARQTEFWGIVKRRIESNQRFTATRVAFFRTEKSIAELEPVLGLHRESEVLDAWGKEFHDLPQILGQLENRIDYQGKSGLWL